MAPDDERRADVTFQVDRATYADAQEILGMLGMTVEKACEILVHKITLCDGIPFSVTLDDGRHPARMPGEYDPLDAFFGSTLPPSFLNALGDYLDDFDDAYDEDDFDEDDEDEEDEDEEGDDESGGGRPRFSGPSGFRR